ncbi:hypothetical protein R1sor_021469 [Riccia sorocarpa]|uniref:Fungal-type protein kinase domain-containing protein n=1 Tax=Riccia sorocarpa TaxID=122646 RepID=A0ABD3GH72_9MARC
MAPAFVGKRLPCVKLMEEQLSSSFASAPQGFLRKTAQFVPYSFKKLADLDLVEFSALTAFKLIKYITGIQRLCVPEDIFWYSFWNTDADGDRLLIKGCNGQTCVVGWHEIAVAFGASHSETEEFRAIKINNKNFSQYRAGDFLMETVETNAQRKLVNGQPYEEISYYKDAASYGPTYFLMNVIAELFWCNWRSTRFTTPMKRARTPDNSKVTPVIWASVFVKILYAYRETVFAGTPLAAADSWVPWVHLSKEGDIDIRGLHAKFPTPIEDLKVIRDSCKLSDNIPIAEPVNGDARDVPTSTPTKIAPRKRSREVQDLDDEPIPQPKSHSSGSPDRQVRTGYTKRRNVTVGARNDPGTSIVPYDDIADGKRTVEPILDDFGTKLGVIFGELASRKLEEAFWPMLADSKATEALKDQLADKCAKMQEAERQTSQT